MADNKPEQQQMGGADSTQLIQQIFGPKESMLVKQTMRGCLQECCGCEAKSEFKVSAMDWPFLNDGNFLSEGSMTQADELYALEKSSFCMRCCWRDGRGFDMDVSQGAEPGGAPIAKFTKPCGFPLQFSIPVPTNQEGDVVWVDCPCCCLLPELHSHTVSPNNEPVKEFSKSRYYCDLCLYVPKLMYSENSEDIYLIKPPTCCLGCCVMPKCKGCCQCYIPFNFHDPKTGEQIKGPTEEQNPMILKVWAGLKKECCSTADTFAVFFPSGCTPERKAGLLGMTFLLDFTVFERQKE